MLILNPRTWLPTLHKDILILDELLQKLNCKQKTSPKPTLIIFSDSIATMIYERIPT
jgi:hypothetical protein